MSHGAIKRRANSPGRPQIGTFTGAEKTYRRGTSQRQYKSPSITLKSSYHHRAVVTSPSSCGSFSNISSCCSKIITRRRTAMSCIPQINSPTGSGAWCVLAGDIMGIALARKQESLASIFLNEQEEPPFPYFIMSYHCTCFYSCKTAETSRRKPSGRTS